MKRGTVQWHPAARRAFAWVFWIGIIGLIPSLPLQGWQELDQRQWQQSYNGFALICRSLGIEPASSISEWQSQEANQSVLIVFGSPRRVPIDLESFVRRGGALLVASDGRRTSLMDNEIFLYSSGWTVRRPRDAYVGLTDCPIVYDISPDHPVTKDVSQIISNRPGGLRLSHRSPYESLARLPLLAQTRRQYDFLVATPATSEQRLLVFADQSIFTNQMLVHGQNGLLALQSLQWLSAGERTNLLILIDGQATSPSSPQAVDVELPPPSKEEILRAINNLPPEKLLQFGNAMAMVIEEEGLVNEFLTTLFKDVSNTRYARSLIFLATFLLGGYLLYRYMASESVLQNAYGTSSQSTQLSKRVLRRKAANDRRRAAVGLISHYYRKWSGGTVDVPAAFPSGLVLGEVYDRKSIWQQMKKTGHSFRRKSQRFWSRNRLRDLKAKLDDWNRLYENGLLTPAGNSGRQSEASIAHHPDSPPTHRS